MTGSRRPEQRDATPTGRRGVPSTLASPRPRRSATIAASPAPARPPQRRAGQRTARRRRWLIVAPLAALAGLIAIAPSPPNPSGRSTGSGLAIRRAGGTFHYAPDDQFFAFDVDPRRVRFDLLEGWDREQDAFADTASLAYFSGPMYERHVNEVGHEITVPLGDLKLGDRVWRGRNRTAARQRAFIGIGHDGHVDFGFGELTSERARRYDTFIGGLHSIYNDLEPAPPEYKGAYSISMGQQIRYFLPRIRMVVGLRGDGRLEVLMSREGLTLEQTRSLARSRGLLAAYLPDHASKSRLIIPGVKGFSQADANWISGGATSFVHVPYLLRVSERPVPLRGNLLASLTPHRPTGGCGTPLECGQALGGQLLDRALAGFNRLMEKGVEPLARLIWAPQTPKGSPAPKPGAPLREPPITADPLALRERQQTEVPGLGGAPPQETPLPPDLPAPLLLQPGQQLPEDPEAVRAESGEPPSPDADRSDGGPSGQGGRSSAPVAPEAGVPQPPPPVPGLSASPTALQPPGAPPPPVLPPPPVPRGN